MHGTCPGRGYAIACLAVVIQGHSSPEEVQQDRGVLAPVEAEREAPNPAPWEAKCDQMGEQNATVAVKSHRRVWQAVT